ncbi:F-box/kelch-repeat protein [Actinidia chinensis var. chinensis]|uniref:F-box/kelch-repeat protein n=1 Tax=Actinidia chinensis var. chinensis TaxID=1590841 RepID=A0A2R6RNR2_ACTCC|nr:F-box/kelch-repeat protein [Actinidia chinensis var. chinensis]
MGAFWSMSGTKVAKSEYNEVSLGETCKRQRIVSICYEENLRLIPSLPDEISIQIFARLPRVCYLNMRLVARNWKAVMMSPELFNLRKKLGMTEEWLYLLIKFEDDKLFWHAFDPWSKLWQRLPPIPNVVYEEESRKGLYGLLMGNMVGQSNNLIDIIMGWLGRKHAPGQLPFGGCAIGTADGCLYVLGGFSKASAMRCVWRYDPIANVWSEVTPMSTGRAYCKTSILNNKLYVVGGVSRGNGGLVPLQSAEVFDPYTGTWSQVPSMTFSKAQVLPAAFMADMLKPIATGMTSYKGRLHVPQSLYSWPFFVDVGGEIYDPETNSWDEMPIGMGEGWPAKHAGTKLSVVVDGELYALDPSSSPNSGKIKVYDEKEDAWKIAIEKVPITDFSESESPYLLTGFHGKLHVITKYANRKIVVLQADACNNMDSFTSSSSESMEESEKVVWKVIAETNFGPAELVSCQVLDI